MGLMTKQKHWLLKHILDVLVTEASVGLSNPVPLSMLSRQLHQNLQYSGSHNGYHCPFSESTSLSVVADEVIQTELSQRSKVSLMKFDVVDLPLVPNALHLLGG
jgi:hypothetical protein